MVLKVTTCLDLMVYVHDDGLQEVLVIIGMLVGLPLIQGVQIRSVKNEGNMTMKIVFQPLLHHVDYVKGSRVLLDTHTASPVPSA